MCSTINLGKFGSFSSNQLIGRPYQLTYELLDRDADGDGKKNNPVLRVVPAAELHAEALGSEHAASAAETRDEIVPVDGAAEFDIVGDDGQVLMRNNRLTVDDPSRQTLSMEEIEELKKAAQGSGKDIIAKIMASHMGIEEKTTFSLAKYTLRKSRKYLKRFTVLPLDVGLLTEYVTEKEAYKIMELRDETLGLICSWANIHDASSSRVQYAEDGVSQIGGGRWLVVDDTGGLVTAALAEKMGILYPPENSSNEAYSGEDEEAAELPAPESSAQNNTTTTATEGSSTTPPNPLSDTPMMDPTTTPAPSTTPSEPLRKRPRPHIPQSAGQTNSLTVLHPNNQPNLSYLKYFSHDATNPLPNHPLYTHLRSLSWLQLLHPDQDPTYSEPAPLSEDALALLKSSKRGTYYRKRRRWERTKRVVDETRRGGFDGLIVASTMEPEGVLRECVPLVRGGGQVVVYSAYAEPLVRLCDLYSKERRAAYVAREFGRPGGATKFAEETDGEGNENGDVDMDMEPEAEGSLDADGEGDTNVDGAAAEEDFPVNPTLLLAPSLQTARAKQWQVLPGRTHPHMTSRGGAEGFLFTATRVLPIEGKVEARGHGRSKKRKIGADTSAQT